MDKLEISDEDRNEIAKLVKEGFTSGILDSGETRISWEIKMEKFEN